MINSTSISCKPNSNTPSAFRPEMVVFHSGDTGILEQRCSIIELDETFHHNHLNTQNLRNATHNIQHQPKTPILPTSSALEHPTSSTIPISHTPISIDTFPNQGECQTCNTEEHEDLWLYGDHEVPLLQCRKRITVEKRISCNPLLAEEHHQQPSTQQCTSQTTLLHLTKNHEQQQLINNPLNLFRENTQTNPYLQNSHTQAIFLEPFSSSSSAQQSQQSLKTPLINSQDAFISESHSNKNNAQTNNEYLPQKSTTERNNRNAENSVTRIIGEPTYTNIKQLPFMKARQEQSGFTTSPLQPNQANENTNNKFFDDSILRRHPSPTHQLLPLQSSSNRLNFNYLGGMNPLGTSSNSLSQQQPGMHLLQTLTTTATRITTVSPQMMPPISFQLPSNTNGQQLLTQNSTLAITPRNIFNNDPADTQANGTSLTPSQIERNANQLRMFPEFQQLFQQQSKQSNTPQIQAVPTLKFTQFFQGNPVNTTITTTQSPQIPSLSRDNPYFTSATAGITTTTTTTTGLPTSISNHTTPAFGNGSSTNTTEPVTPTTSADPSSGTTPSSTFSTGFLHSIPVPIKPNNVASSNHPNELKHPIFQITQSPLPQQQQQQQQLQSSTQQKSRIINQQFNQQIPISAIEPAVSQQCLNSSSKLLLTHQGSQGETHPQQLTPRSLKINLNQIQSNQIVQQPHSIVITPRENPRYPISIVSSTVFQPPIRSTSAQSPNSKQPYQLRTGYHQATLLNPAEPSNQKPQQPPQPAYPVNSSIKGVTYNSAQYQSSASSFLIHHQNDLRSLDRNTSTAKDHVTSLQQLDLKGNQKSSCIQNVINPQAKSFKESQTHQSSQDHVKQSQLHQSYSPTIRSTSQRYMSEISNWMKSRESKLNSFLKSKQNHQGELVKQAISCYPKQYPRSESRGERHQHKFITRPVFDHQLSPTSNSNSERSSQMKPSNLVQSSTNQKIHRTDAHLLQQQQQQQQNKPQQTILATTNTGKSTFKLLINKKQKKHEQVNSNNNKIPNNILFNQHNQAPLFLQSERLKVSNECNPILPNQIRIYEQSSNKTSFGMNLLSETLNEKENKTASLNKVCSISSHESNSKDRFQSNQDSFTKQIERQSVYTRFNNNNNLNDVSNSSTQSTSNSNIIRHSPKTQPLLQFNFNEKQQQHHFEQQPSEKQLDNYQHIVSSKLHNCDTAQTRIKSNLSPSQQYQSSVSRQSRLQFSTSKDKLQSNRAHNNQISLNSSPLQRDFSNTLRSIPQVISSENKRIP